MIKLVFCLTRRDHLSHEEFLDYWRGIHGPLVASHAGELGIRRYVQSHPSAVGLSIAAVRRAPEPYDGVAELWFDDFDAVTATTPVQRAIARLIIEDERAFIDLSRSPIFLAEESVLV
jgi:uncharacterized protein (TIGR02118 family)